jgi:nicotinamidase-related amidase
MRFAVGGCVAVIVDVQERLLPHIDNHQGLEQNLVTLIRGLRALQVPLLATQQYPKGLGPTLPSIVSALDEEAGQLVDKITFSCCDEPDFMERFVASGRHLALLAGIEAHVCVQQTVLDLLAAGYECCVVADCVGSRRPQDRDVALQRVAREGARVATLESLLFELCRTAGTDTFKSISRLVK